jgi:translation elongation factor EF-Tu-like GTPase
MGLFDFLFKKPKDEFDNPYMNGNNRTNSAGYGSYNAQSDTEWNNLYQQNENWQNSSAYGDIQENVNRFIFKVEDVFTITGRGIVVTGRVTSGSVDVGYTVEIHKANGKVISTMVAGIESFRKMKTTAVAGENVGILLQGISKSDVSRGDILQA